MINRLRMYQKIHVKLYVTQVFLSEVYLIYADAILGNNPSTDDADAMEYFNKVRKRAGLEPQNSITYEDIRRERRLELCLEDSIGMTWYVELIINNRKYSIISPDRIGVLLFL